MPVSTLTSKGQLTLPKQIRERLNLRSGDRVEFRLTDEGQVMVEAASQDLRSLKGFLKARRRLTLEDMDVSVRGGGTRS